MGKINRVISSDVLASWKRDAIQEDVWTKQRFLELIDSHETLRSTHEELCRITRTEFR